MRLFSRRSLADKRRGAQARSSVLPAWLGLLLALGACGDNAKRALEIVPGPSNTFCTSDDNNVVLDGIQVDIQVNAIGFTTSDVVHLAVDGIPDTQTAQSVPSSGALIFSGVTLGEGAHAVVAESADRAIRSDALVVTIDSIGPVLAFVRPTDNETLGQADDKDPNTADLEYDVEVVTDLADTPANPEPNDSVHIQLTPPGGIDFSLPDAPVTNQRAIAEARFNQRGDWTLVATARDQCGNETTDTSHIVVTVDPPPCIVRIRPTPINVPNLNVPVLNQALDMSPAPNFQSVITAQANPGDEVTLIIDGTVFSVVTADANGVASWNQDLTDGDRTIQARCRDNGGNEAFSLAARIFVDITPPVCALVPPIVNGYQLTPAQDEIPATPATDFTVAANVSGGDANGELATFTVGLAQSSATVTGGIASVLASLSAPQTGVPITVSAHDHAQNTCSATVAIDYSTQGCAITWVSPLSTVISDADNGTTGFQANVVIEVDPACQNRQVRLLNCDINGVVSATATGSPARATIPVTACTTSACETTRNCTAEVTNAANITTSVNAPLTVDNVPPSVLMQVISPAVPCGATITPASDFDPVTSGTQVQARLFSLSAPTRWFEVNQGPDVNADAAGYATLTVTMGTNDIVAFVTDATTLTGMSSVCSITLSTLAVSITSPINGQTLGPADGTVSGTDLLVNVCGTVGETGAGVTVNVVVDGGAPLPATLTGNTWCRNSVPLGTGAHTIVADGNNSMTGNNGSAGIAVTVDLVPPNDPTDFAGNIVNRATIRATFTEPSDGGATVQRCEVRSSLAPIDAGNFAAATLRASLPGAGAGTAQSVNVSRLRLGPANTWHLAARCEDNAGNLSGVISSGPHVLSFTGTSAIVPAASPEVPGKTTTNAWLGDKIVGADLNGDGFSDVVVGAPQVDLNGDSQGDGAVYIYMGGPTGIGAAPDFVIRSTGSNEFFGSGLTALDWNNDNVKDLAIAAPLGGGFAGEVRIFFGGAVGFAPTGTTSHLIDTDADVVVSSDGANPWFQFGFLGWDLDALDFDGDGRDDLLMGVPGADSFRGGGIVLFNGAPTLTIPTGLSAANARAYRFTFSTSAQNAQFGTRVYSLGRLGDGGADARDDLLIAPDADSVQGPTPVLSEDRVFVYYGRAQPVANFADLASTSAEEQIVGEVESDEQNRYGLASGSIADVNGDSRREIVIAAAAYGTTPGRVYVLAGGTTTVGSPITRNAGSSSLFTVTGTGSLLLGRGVANSGVAGGGDVEADGLDDLILSSGANPSSYYVFFATPGMAGSLTPANAAASLVAPNGFAGLISAAWVGDVDGDGLDDLARGYHDPGLASSAGMVQVLY